MDIIGLGIDLAEVEKARVQIDAHVVVESCKDFAETNGTIFRFAAPFDPVARGHLLHHKYNGAQGYSVGSENPRSPFKLLKWQIMLFAQPYTLISLATLLTLMPVPFLSFTQK